jgi:hypothetical protein
MFLFPNTQERPKFVIFKNYGPLKLAASITQNERKKTRREATSNQYLATKY